MLYRQLYSAILVDSFGFFSHLSQVESPQQSRARHSLLSFSVWYIQQSITNILALWHPDKLFETIMHTQNLSWFNLEIFTRWSLRWKCSGRSPSSWPCSSFVDISPPSRRIHVSRLNIPFNQFNPLDNQWHPLTRNATSRNRSDARHTSIVLIEQYSNEYKSFTHTTCARCHYRNIEPNEWVNQWIRVWVKRNRFHSLRINEVSLSL